MLCSVLLAVLSLGGGGCRRYFTWRGKASIPNHLFYNICNCMRLCYLQMVIGQVIFIEQLFLFAFW